MGFKEEISFKKEPMPSNRVVDIKDNKIIREGDKV